MSDLKVNTAKIGQIARNIDKKGDNNGVIDKNEISLFADELEKSGIKNAKKIINDYVKNPRKYESSFALNGDSANDSDENLIMSWLNPNSELSNHGKDDAKRVDKIHKDIKDAVGLFADWQTVLLFHVYGIWGTDEEKLDDAVSRIDKDIVLQVLNKKYDDSETLLQAIVGDVDQTAMDKYGKTIINALIQKAKEFGIDTTSIVEEENGKYIVRSDVKGADYGTSATDKKNIEKVIDALNNHIRTELEIMAGKEKSQGNSQNNGTQLLTLAAKADRDPDGELKGAEIAEFKKLCAESGIYINQILSNIREKDGSNLTETEKEVKNIFSSNIKTIVNNNKAEKNSAAAVTSGIKNSNIELLRSVINEQNITADNVEQFLASLEKNENFMNIHVGVSTYRLNGTTINYPIYSKNNDIGEKLTYKLGEKSREFTQVIVSALYKKAQNENIHVDDIVTKSNNRFLTGSSVGQIDQDALSSQYVNKVIEQLRSRIKEELGE